MSQQLTPPKGKCKVVVVGSGLAGFCAALEAHERGSEVILVEKNNFLGGNSSLASSGMNAVNTPANPDDTVKQFYDDTIKSGGGFSNPKLVEILVNESSDAVKFLTKYGVDLSVVGLTGGHSHARTHRARPRADGKVENIGRHIINKLSETAKGLPSFRILLGTSVSGLILNNNGKVVGVESSTVLETKQVHVDRIFADAVVLATGGYAADKALLSETGAKLLTGLPTTNGSWASGEGIKMARKIGAHVIHLDKVQIHPTGIVDVKDPFNEKKWLCPEALRGCGSILLTSRGERFVNELGTRDFVTSQIFEKCQTYPSKDPAVKMNVAYMVLSTEVAANFDMATFNFYKGKGLIQTVPNSEELAKVIGCDHNTLLKTLEKYNALARGEAKDEFGRTNAPFQIKPQSELHYIIITPSIHYTMGGVEMSERTEVLDEQNKPIKGLYAAGEVTGGVHGNNRLGGNSLLECVVFGRRAGRIAVEDWGHTSMPQVPTFVDATGKVHESVLDPNKFIPLRLKQRYQLNKTNHIFSFDLPNPDSHIGLLIGQYIAVRAIIDGKEVVRFYSPVSRNSDFGKIDLLIKIEPEKSYPGSMTHYLNTLSVGNTLDFKGPLGGFEYHRNMYREVGMIAGGTGISPMVQIIRSVTGHPEDKTKLTLLYGNYFEDDILCKDELMYYSATRDNVSTYITLNTPPPHWKMGKGFITEEMIKEHMPPPAKDIKIVMCGPPAMITVIKGYLTKLGYTEDMIYSFV